MVAVDSRALSGCCGIGGEVLWRAGRSWEWYSGSPTDSGGDSTEHSVAGDQPEPHLQLSL